MFEFERFSHGEYSLDYAIDYPVGFDKNKKYPVLFYFHGMGAVGKGVKFTSEACPVNRSRMNDDMDFIIVDPACMDFTWFENFGGLVSFIKHIISQPYADENRIFISGSSMGGYTAWALAVMHPELFAAGVICCGGGLYALAERIKFPVRAYHGALDPLVLPRESELMVEYINATGGNAELFLCDGVGHDVWNVAYTDKENYYWLLGQKK